MKQFSVDELYILQTAEELVTDLWEEMTRNRLDLITVKTQQGDMDAFKKEIFLASRVLRYLQGEIITEKD